VARLYRKKNNMKRASEQYFSADQNDWEDMGPGVSRQILGWDKQIMMVKVKFEKGAVGSPHNHFHTQTTYCDSGKFEFSIGENKHILKEGDALYIPPNEMHSAVCLEAGIVLDVFSPVREDFLSGDGPSYLGGED
jgi:quercetin dioxygenase-like cupin family protein